MTIQALKTATATAQAVLQPVGDILHELDPCANCLRLFDPAGIRSLSIGSAFGGVHLRLPIDLEQALHQIQQNLTRLVELL